MYTMRKVKVTANFPNIATFNLTEFKNVAARALEITRNEPGVLQYDWYLDDTKTVCVVHEIYQDAESLLAHISALGSLLDKLSDLGGGCELQTFAEHSLHLGDTAGTPHHLERTTFRSTFQQK
jgi:hypothetical protein